MDESDPAETSGQFETNVIVLLYAVNLVGGWATPLKNMKVNWDD